MEMKARTGTAIAMLLTCALVFQFQVCAQDASCVKRLIPCLNYLNGTSRDPTASCCDPLRSVIESNPDCLCSLISREGSHRAEQAGIDVDKAQLLPGRCGQHVNPLSCLVDSGSRDGVSNVARAIVSSTLMAFVSLIVQFLWAENSPITI